MSEADDVQIRMKYVLPRSTLHSDANLDGYTWHEKVVVLVAVVRVDFELLEALKQSKTAVAKDLKSSNGAR